MRNRRGVGLLMLLFALAVVSFFLIPIFSSFSVSRMGAEKSVYYLIAANLISSQMEDLRNRPYPELEDFLLHVRDEATNPRPIDPMNGPFESNPETPDIVEKGAYNAGKVVFDRYTFISYFPHKNPDPSRPDFYVNRQRIRIRIDVLWKEPVAGQPPREQRVTVSSLVHNENYNPQPGLFQGGGMLR